MKISITIVLTTLVFVIKCCEGYYCGMEQVMRYQPCIGEVRQHAYNGRAICSNCCNAIADLYYNSNCGTYHPYSNMFLQSVYYCSTHYYFYDFPRHPQYCPPCRQSQPNYPLPHPSPPSSHSSTPLTPPPSHQNPTKPPPSSHPNPTKPPPSSHPTPTKPPPSSHPTPTKPPPSRTTTPSSPPTTGPPNKTNCSEIMQRINPCMNDIIAYNNRGYGEISSICCDIALQASDSCNTANGSYAWSVSISGPALDYCRNHH